MNARHCTKSRFYNIWVDEQFEVDVKYHLMNYVNHQNASQKTLDIKRVIKTNLTT